MVWPVAFPLEAFLTRAGITALGSTAASEGIKSLQNQGTISPDIAREAFMRTLVGPTTEILNRTTDTPSGKVFAPTGEIIEPNQIPGISPPTEQPQGLPGLIAAEQNRQLPGMDQATPPTQNKGFTMPTAEDMSILYKKAPVATKKLNQLGDDQIKSFFDKQETLFDDDYERGIKSYSEDNPLTDKAIIGMKDIVQTRPNQYQPVHRYWEDMWAGGVGDVGERLAGEVMRSGGMLETSEGIKAPSYYEEYKGKLQDLAIKELGKDFVGYRLMSRAEMEDMLQGGKSIGDVKSYSLDKGRALAFKNFSNEAFTDKETGKPRTDLVLAEAPLNYEGLVMRGKADEKEVVYDNQFTSMNEVNFYDLNGNLIKGAEEGMLSKPKEQSTETMPTQDLTVENIQNKIKYKKSKFNNNITEAYLGDKKIAEISKDLDSEKTGNQFNYRINWVNEKGEIDADDYDIETGLNSAKRITAIGFVNSSKSKEKEYLNKLIKAIENKDYDKLNKIREEEGGYDFEDSEFRSKQFNDTINKYRPDIVKLSTKAYNEQQEAISELNIKEKPIEPKDIEKEITFKKSESANTYDVLYKGKLIKQLYKKGTKYEGQNEYVVIEPSDGSYDDTFIGLDNSKERVKQNIARQILEKNTSKSAGSLIDKPLSDE